MFILSAFTFLSNIYSIFYAEVDWDWDCVNIMNGYIMYFEESNEELTVNTLQIKLICMARKSKVGEILVK